jgi:predicted ester cyclase
MPDDTERNKEVVSRLVVDVINEWRIDELGRFFSPEAASRAREDFESFRSTFPDWQMEIKELIAEGDTVVARFVCHGTHLGPWQSDEPTGKTMAVDEVFFFRFDSGRIRAMWALEDTWTRMRQLGLR